jgi:hypothetical protein
VLSYKIEFNQHYDDSDSVSASLCNWRIRDINAIAERIGIDRSVDATDSPVIRNNCDFCNKNDQSNQIS